MSTRIYRGTATTSSWYNEGDNEARNLELHFRVSLSGDVRRNRLELAKVGTSLLERMVRQRYGRKISPDKIKIKYEREEPGKTPSWNAQVEPIEFTYGGKTQLARRLPSMVVDFSKLPKRIQLPFPGLRQKRRQQQRRRKRTRPHRKPPKHRRRSKHSKRRAF